MEKFANHRNEFELLKKPYLINNIGCDDTTTAIIELTQDEFDFLNNIFQQINKNSSYSCQPKIEFDLEVTFEKIEGYENEDDYREKTGNYISNIETINGNVYLVKE